MIGTTRNGWIGIDLGAASLKLAQLTRRNGQLELATSASVRRSTGDDPIAALRSDLETLLAVAGELQGKQTAAVLSMNACRLESGRQKTPSDASDGAAWSSAAWPTGVESSDPDAGWYTLAVNAAQADAVADGLLGKGLSCRTIDGGPQAVARAIGMVRPQEDDSPTAAIDWGWSAATFLSVRSGYPVYVRTLKNCGLNSAAAAIAAELGMTADEARDALAKHPPSAPTAQTPHRSASEDPLAAELSLLARPLFDRLQAEAQRTLTHLQTHRRQASPESLCLLGGGAALPGVVPWLEQATKLPTSLWRPPGADGPGANGPGSNRGARDWSVLGPAIALSALAWEAR